MASNQQRRLAFRFIIALGIVSLFADMTYEGARSIVGPFLKDLGASATEVGIIAGFGEMIAASLRLFSGRLVDRTRAYWTIAALGYFLNLVAVPVFQDSERRGGGLTIGPQEGNAMAVACRVDTDADADRCSNRGHRSSPRRRGKGVIA